MESTLKDIALVAFDRFTDVDLFLMWDILGRNNTDWRVRILGAQPVLHSAHGLTIPTHGPLVDANHADAVLFSSGKEGVPAALAHPDFLPSFDLDPERQLVRSICGGVSILERLGLLPERRATTHPDARKGLQALGLDVLNQPLVCHRNVATAGGCLASVYPTGWLVESMFDADKRRETLLPVLPAGQREIYEDLIEFRLRQGREQTSGSIKINNACGNLLP